MTHELSNPVNQGNLPCTGHTNASSYGHMEMRNMGYRRGIGDKKVILVPDLILVE
jgi:hypothetical protein